MHACMRAHVYYVPVITIVYPLLRFSDTSSIQTRPAKPDKPTRQDQPKLWKAHLFWHLSVIFTKSGVGTCTAMTIAYPFAALQPSSSQPAQVCPSQCAPKTRRTNIQSTYNMSVDMEAFSLSRKEIPC